MSQVSTRVLRRRTLLALFVFGLLFALLFQYRILSLLKKLGADVTPFGTKFPIVFDLEHAPQWLLPVYHTLDYLNAIWFNTLLGLLIGGAAITFLPGLVRGRLRGNGLAAHIIGMVLGIPNMLCSCCAVCAFTGLYKAGASFGPSLAFLVAAPTLNVVTLILAFELLPLKLALARLMLGLVAAFGATLVAVRLERNKLDEIKVSPAVGDEQSTGQMISHWLACTYQITRGVLPVLLLGFLIVGVFRTVLPFESVAKHFGNNLLSTLAASAIGTFLMVPTFTEVLWVGELTKHGMGTGPAVALLVTLPAVSFPSLWVFGRVTRSSRVAVAVGILIAAVGVVGGTIFLII